MLDSEAFFRQLLAVSKCREVNLENVLKHELSAVSPSLFYDGGSMRKTTKSDLAKILEHVEACLEETLVQLPGNMPTAYILNGITWLQAIKEASFTTFEDIAKMTLNFLKNLLKNGQGVETIAMVFDRYDHH